MKRLFICHANVGRSQAAMELYRQRGGEADSAGTEVDKPGTTLAERPGAVTILQVMRDDYGIDMQHNVRTQLTQQQAAPYDQIIVITAKDSVPKWLLDDPRMVFWDIVDAIGQNTSVTRNIVHEVADRVHELPLE